MSAILYKDRVYGGGVTVGDIQALAYKQLTPQQYEALSQAEKTNGIIYFVSNNSTGVEGLTVIRIAKADYENLTQTEKNNGVPYFVYQEVDLWERFI